MLSPPALLRLIVRSQTRHVSHYSAVSQSGRVAERNVIDELESRGYVSALTNPGLRQHVASPSCLYAGVDPSASSLHVGNLLPLMGLLHFKMAGHKAIAIIGGATGSIGDPSGRSTERNALASDELDRNVRGITDQVERFFQLGSEYAGRRGGYERAVDEDAIRGELEVLNNLEWTQGVGLLDFLRTVGKMARVNVMLARDSVKNRLSSDSGISYTEFTYQLLQASDFLHLYRTRNCTIQLGGSDQWGNIVAGIDLIKRMAADEARQDVQDGSGLEEGKGREPAYGLTIPLLTTSSGEKFGKSAGNAVWLDQQRTSVSDFYQFFLRSTDEDVERYLRIFSWLKVDEIDELMTQHFVNKKARTAQKTLADEVTELVHGEQAVKKAQTAAVVLYQTNPRLLKADDIISAFEGDPRFHRVTWSDIKGLPVTKLAVQYGLCKARGETVFSVQAGGLFVNDRKVNDPRYLIVRQEMVQHRIAIVRLGSKNHMILCVED
ncbi:tyrosine-tRNA ligase [Dioszegia hungarica]|uniref:Tyrosine--tRNA ligase n=1 Tax=Dioszegia hungarica TaxID=4972 RepID=A0AA38LV61_9TREE|nr:tyrosine-tRNA ligase [Dioszegia hungarica]KAI9636133.1 tyrosine-tRNA ligase [Dioszegia hungarica]